MSSSASDGRRRFCKKPFSQRLLLGARQGGLRRAGSRDGAAAPQEARQSDRAGQAGDGPDRHSCTWDGRPLTLTVTEFLILQSLSQLPHRQSRDALWMRLCDQVMSTIAPSTATSSALRKKFNQVDASAFDGSRASYASATASRSNSPRSGGPPCWTKSKPTTRWSAPKARDPRCWRKQNRRRSAAACCNRFAPQRLTSRIVLLISLGLGRAGRRHSLFQPVPPGLIDAGCRV